MAQQQKPKNTFLTHIAARLTLAPEERTQENKGKYPAGHFKKFFDIFRSNMQVMLTGNLLTLIFALPLLAVILYTTTIGIENFSYLLEGIDAPYVMTGLGIGLSAGAGLAQTRITMLIAVRVLTLGIAVCMPILSFGIAGSMHLSVKLMWGEDFITKKNKYGKDVPRVVTEYFIGVKKHWKQMLILFGILGILIAGISNLIINFVAGLWGGGANAGEWIGLIFACIIGFVALLMYVHMLPDVVMRKMPIWLKAKNALLLDVAFFIPTLLIAILIALPFLLLLLGSILAFLVGIAVIVIGFSYITLALAGYADYESEAILNPLYEATQKTAKKPNKKKKKK